MNDITERVERGAALLDEKMPGWWQRIDLGTLDISSGCNCIAGQLAPGRKGEEEDYLRGLRALGIATVDQEENVGFDADMPTAGVTQGEKYDTLTAVWRDLITRRREMASVAG